MHRVSVMEGMRAWIYLNRSEVSRIMLNGIVSAPSDEFTSILERPLSPIRR